MDINEFRARIKPEGKRSSMTPFQADIETLADDGYSNGQIAEYLAGKGLQVTAEAVRRYRLKLAGQQQSTSTRKPKAAEPTPSTSEPQNSATDKYRAKGEQYVNTPKSIFTKKD